MACNIVLVGIQGITNLDGCVTSVEVSGTAQDCEQLQLTILYSDLESQLNLAVDNNGNWQGVIPTPPEDDTCNFKCGASYQLKVFCLDNPDCELIEAGAIDCEEPNEPIPDDDCPRLVAHDVIVGDCDEENPNLRNVTFNAAVFAGAADTTVQFETSDNQQSEEFFVEANQELAIDYTASMQPNENNHAVLVVVAPNECEGIRIEIPDMDDCDPPGAENCPDIQIAISDSRCVEDQHQVTITTTISVPVNGDITVAEWSSGIPNQNGGAQIIAPGQEHHFEEVFTYPPEEEHEATLSVLMPEGCDDISLPIPSLDNCGDSPADNDCLTADDLSLHVTPRGRNCHGRGNDIEVTIRHNNAEVDEDTYDFEWIENGELSQNTQSFHQITVGAEQIIIEATVGRQGCNSVSLSTTIRPCECPPDPEDLRIEVNRNPEAAYQGESCYQHRNVDPLVFTLNSEEVERNNLQAATWDLHRLDHEREDRIEDGIAVVDGASYTIDPDLLASGEYRLIATVLIAPGCRAIATKDFYICPKGEEECPQANIQVNFQQNLATIRVTIADPRQLQHALEHGFHIEYGDGNGADIAGDAVNDQNQWVIEYAYATPGQRSITVSFPNIGQDCGSESDPFDTPERPTPDTGGGGRGGNCGFFDFDCWDICGTLARAIGVEILALLTTLLFMTPGTAMTIVAAIGGALIAASIGFYFAFRCPRCLLGTSILMAVASFVALVLVLGIFGAALPGLVVSGITAAGFAAMGAGMRYKC